MTTKKTEQPIRTIPFVVVREMRVELTRRN